MKRLCTICARGGSKGVKNKNIRLIAGKPLIAHSLEQARQSGLFAHIAVSSDSDAILKVAEEWGADQMIQRPLELARDDSAKIPAIRHCVEQAELHTQIRFDILVDLDATSPLRLPDDILGAVTLLESKDISNVITAAPARRSPYFNLVEQDENGAVHLSKQLSSAVVRRQDSPPCFDMNASIYVWRRQAFMEQSAIFYKDTGLFIMPEERSIDIDTELDFDIVSMLMEKRSSK